MSRATTTARRLARRGGRGLPPWTMTSRADRDARRHLAGLRPDQARRREIVGRHARARPRRQHQERPGCARPAAPPAAIAPARWRPRPALPARLYGLVAHADSAAAATATARPRVRARARSSNAPSRSSSSFCASRFDGRSSLAGTEAMYSTSAVVAPAPRQPAIVRTTSSAQPIRHVAALRVFAQRRRQHAVVDAAGELRDLRNHVGRRQRGQRAGRAGSLSFTSANRRTVADAIRAAPPAPRLPTPARPAPRLPAAPATSSSRADP